ncbi:hypothetical protein ACF0H5_024268 [Mactra antiquata]
MSFPWDNVDRDSNLATMMLMLLLLFMLSLVRVTEGYKLDPNNPLHLDTDATHVCTREEKLSYSVMTSFTEYYHTTYTTWCFAFPPRCTRYRRNSRKAYKSTTLYRQRDHLYCCPGYKAYPGIDHCVPACRHDCNQDRYRGVCVKPNVCKCRPGYHGLYCGTDCPPHKWGAQCANLCHCGPHSTCDPYKGNCVCKVGYTGLNCTEQCDQSFGLECAHPCKCENGATCDHITGRCTCAPGYYGPLCQQKCSYSTLEEQGCEQTCPCQNDGKCHPVTGNCVCPPGYKGEVCTETCDKNQWGTNCLKNCFCNFGRCDVETGACICDHGHAGFRCERQCLEGWYGKGCLTKCICENGGKCFFDDSKHEVQCDCRNTGYHGEWCTIRNCPEGETTVNITSTGEVICGNCSCDWNSTESCHPLDGKCFCGPGYIGDNCSTPCEMPNYGYNCTSTCACANGDCHHVTGNCTDCYAGYIGEYCNETCPNNTWGVQCVNKCECLNGGTCKINTGYCACAAGFYGIRCELECGQDKYGSHCEYECDCHPNTTICDPYTGECHCKRGYTGFFCNEICPNGWYGIHCRQLCDCNTKTSRCDPEFGRCDCIGSYYGVRCDKKCPSHLWGPYCKEYCNCSDKGICDQHTGSCICDNNYYGDKCEKELFTMGNRGLKTGEKKQGSPDEKKVSSMVIPAVIVLVIVIVLGINVTRRYWHVKDRLTDVIFRREKRFLINDKYAGDSDTDDENKDKATNDNTEETSDINPSAPEHASTLDSTSSVLIDIESPNDVSDTPGNSDQAYIEGDNRPLNPTQINNSEPLSPTTLDEPELDHRPSSSMPIEKLDPEHTQPIPTVVDEAELGYRPSNPTPIDNSEFSYRQSNPVSHSVPELGQRVSNPGPQNPIMLLGAPVSASGINPDENEIQDSQKNNHDNGNNERRNKDNKTDKSGYEATNQQAPSSCHQPSEVSRSGQMRSKSAMGALNSSKKPPNSVPQVSESGQRPPNPVTQVSESGQRPPNPVPQARKSGGVAHNFTPHALGVGTMRSKSSLGALNSGRMITKPVPQASDPGKKPPNPVPQASACQTPPKTEPQATKSGDVAHNFTPHGLGVGMMRSKSSLAALNSGRNIPKPVPQASVSGLTPITPELQSSEIGQINPFNPVKQAFESGPRSSNHSQQDAEYGQTPLNPIHQVPDAGHRPPNLAPQASDTGQGPPKFDSQASESRLGRSNSAPPGSTSDHSAFNTVQQASETVHRPLDSVPEASQIPPNRKLTTSSSQPFAPFMFATLDQKRSTKRRRYGEEIDSIRGNKSKMFDDNNRPPNPVPPKPALYVPSLISNSDVQYGLTLSTDNTASNDITEWLRKDIPKRKIVLQSKVVPKRYTIPNDETERYKKTKQRETEIRRDYTPATLESLIDSCDLVN